MVSTRFGLTVDPERESRPRAKDAMDDAALGARLTAISKAIDAEARTGRFPAARNAPVGVWQGA
jgi:hypothetical protein